MNYINPFCFFEINSLDHYMIQQAKKEKLVELALSKNHYIVYNEITIHDDLLLELADELTDPMWSKYHLFIHEYPYLSDFLEYGTPIFFEKTSPHEIFDNDAFLDFIIPFLPEALELALIKAFQYKDSKLLQKIQEHSWYREVNISSVHNPQPDVLTPLKTELEYQIAEIKQAYKVINYANASATDIEKQLDILRTLIHTDSLNALPSQLGHYRNSIALMCCSVAKILYNLGDTEAIDFFEFADYAHQLSTTGHAQNMTTTTYRRFQQAYYHRLGIEMEGEKIQWEANDSYLNKAVKTGIDEITKLKTLLSARAVQEQGYMPRQLRTACAIIQNVSTPTFFEYLRKSDYSKIRQQTLSDIYFILTMTAAYKRGETIQTIELFKQLFIIEPHFHGKFKQLYVDINRAIDKEIVDPNYDENNPFKRKLSDSKNQASSHLDKFKEKFPLPKSVRAFFAPENGGQDRLIQLIPVLATLLMFFILFLAAWKYLNTSVDLTTQELKLAQKKVYRWNTVDYTKETFYTKRSEFVGNQLPNGANPFSQCFGENNTAITGNILSFYNPFSSDAIVCVYDTKSNIVYQQAYVAEKSTFEFKHLPNGSYSMKLYLGKNWNPLKPNFCSLHGAFDANPHYKKLKKKFPLVLTGGTPISVSNWKETESIPMELFFDISAGGYFNNRIKRAKE